MSRVFRTETGAARRNRKLREIATALRAAGEGDPGHEEAKDMTAFILLSLTDIERTIEQAAVAWERRDYWVKADRFREEWRWVSATAERLRRALESGDVEAAQSATVELAGPMHSVKAYKSKHRRPWEGAWREWRAQQEAPGPEGELAPDRIAEDNVGSD